MLGCIDMTTLVPKDWRKDLFLLTAFVACFLGCSRARTGDMAKGEDRKLRQIPLQAEVDRIQDDIREREIALFAGDYETHLDSAHPVLFALGGGRATVQQVLEADRDAFAGMDLKEVAFPSEPMFLRGTRNEFAIAPVMLVVQVRGDLIETTTFQLGVRAIGSSDWKYLDGSRLRKDDLVKLFPDFPSEHELPESVMKTLEM